MSTGIEVKNYKLKALPNKPIPNAILYIKSDSDTTISTYITDVNGIPYPLKDNSETGSGVQTVFNTDGTISVIGTENVKVSLSSSLLTLINSSLQPGDNISELLNDEGYLKTADLPNTKAEFNAQLSDGDFLFVGDVVTYTDEQAQDAVGGILIDSSTIDINYNDITPNITASVKPNSITSTELANNINLTEFVNNAGYITTADLPNTKAEYNTSLIDGDFLFVGDLTGGVQSVTGASINNADPLNPILRYYIKSNESLTLALRKGDTLYGILDQYTGEEIVLNKINFTPYSVDNIIYFQLGSEYFKREYFNGVKITWFGAKPNDQLIDNHDYIMMAINYVFSLGNDSETIIIPKGEFFTSFIDIPNFPSNLYPDLVFKPIVFKGENMPSQLFGTVGSVTLGNSGSILTSKSNVTGKAVLRADAPVGEFSYINLQVYDLEIRTYDNPIISGIDASNAQQMILNNVHISSGVYGVDATEPTTASSYALKTPKLNNAALTYWGNLSISGYYNAVEVNEHTQGIYTSLFCCKYGLVFKNAYHSSYFTRVDLCRNTYNVSFMEGVHNFKIDVLNTEHAGASQITPTNSWQINIYDISDPNNYGRGSLNWHTVLGNNSSPNYVFNILGGNNIACSNLSIAEVATTGGYFGGRFRHQSHTLDNASRIWETRTDTELGYGTWGLRKETGYQTKLFNNVLVGYVDGQMEFMGKSPIVPNAILNTQAVNLGQLNTVLGSNRNQGMQTIALDGSSTVYSISHGLGVLPVFAYAGRGDSTNFDVFNTTWNATNIIITYENPPLAGSLEINWIALK